MGDKSNGTFMPKTKQDKDSTTTATGHVMIRNQAGGQGRISSDVLSDDFDQKQKRAFEIANDQLAGAKYDLGGGDKLS